MCPTEAQRFRLVCSATRRTPSRYFSKSRLDRPWPWVTMQKRCAPAASAARACSSTCSGSIIACIGVSASAKRDCAQKPQSSAQPPDLALTSEHMSVESREALHARFPRALQSSASICCVVLDLAQTQRFLAGDQRRHAPHVMAAWRTAIPRASAAGVSRRRRSFPRACPARRTRRGAARSAPPRPPRAARPRRRSSAAITRLLPSCDSGALPASSPATSSATASSSSAGATRLTSPHAARWARRCSCRAGTARACAPRRSRR